MTDKIKIVTWNINSIRARLHHVRRLIKQEAPDILGLQEIKVVSDKFPTIGSTHRIHATINGQPSYNGVALLHKKKGKIEQINNIETNPLSSFDEFGARVVTSVFRGIRFVNVYIPLGAKNDEAYIGKLRWLSQLDYFLKQQEKFYKYVVVLGDFNIVPTVEDSHVPEFQQSSLVCFTDTEREWLLKLRKRYVDCYSHLYPRQNDFTVWDYRQNSFNRNAGHRIDFVLVTKNMRNFISEAKVLVNYRRMKKPSDHAPLMVELIK